MHMLPVHLLLDMYRKVFGTKYSGMNQAKFVEGNL